MELMHAFQKYGGLLCNYAYSYLNNREEAEDVVQEVFLQLLETEKVFPFNDIAIKSYLLKSVRNSCLNILKKKKHFWSIRKTEVKIFKITWKNKPITRIICIRLIRCGILYFPVRKRKSY